MNKTLLDLRLSARQRADMAEDSGAIGDLELNQYINEAYHELYDLITVADEARLFTKNATQPPYLEEHAFYLPYDFYRLVSVHVLREDRYVAAIPADPSDYARLAALSVDSSSEMNYRYFVRWDINTGERFIFVFPLPSSEALAITYWPQPKELSLDSDSLDNPASWLEFVTVCAAIKMLDRVERDATALLLAKRQLEKRITKAVYASDFNYPRVIRDVAYQGRFGDSW